MKRLFLVVAILALLAVPTSAFAATGITYTTGVQIQNLSGTPANIAIDFYNTDGTQPASSTVSDSIPGNQSKTYFPLNSVPTGFNGSAVISSDQPVASITNVLGNNGQRGDSYAGFSAGGQTVNVPLLFKNAWTNDTWISVQNMGSTDASVSIAYKGYEPNGNPNVACSDGPYTIKANSSRTFDQATTACLGTRFVGAGTITSNQPVAAVVMEVTGTGLMAYAGFSDSSQAPVMPLILSNAYGNFTGVQVMNVGTQSTNVTISFTAGNAGKSCTETQTVAAGKSGTFGYPMPASCYTTAGGMFVGAGKVTANSANQGLVAIVNHITNRNANASSYNAIDASKATSKVSFPIVFDRIYGLYTGISVVNMGTQATNVSCTFSNSAVTVSQSNLQPGQALLHVQKGQIADKYVGSGVCTATGGDAKISAIADENKDATAAEDVQMTYPGISF